MDASIGISGLKRTLLEEVRGLFRSNGSAWKEPILEVLEDLRRSNVQAVLFGGTLRSLLVSRIFQGKFGRPRDVDIVVSGAPLSTLERKFSDIIARRTRFGGLQLKRGRWHFDVWPVGETWAFQQNRGIAATFSELPSTTTFNLEAIAVEAWSKDRRPRAVFSGNDQFFEGILTRTLELNRADNPFPELTVVRAVTLAAELRFRIGPVLSSYVARFGLSLGEKDFDRIQASHYGYPRMNGRTLKQFVELIASRSSQPTSIALPPMGQLHFWESTRESTQPRMRLHYLSPDLNARTRPSSEPQVSDTTAAAGRPT